jgi:hypothetical protein
VFWAERLPTFGYALVILSVQFATASAGSAPPAEGCSLVEPDIALAFPKLSDLASEANFESLGRTTGNPELDQMLDLALKRLADTFQVYPGFGFYDDDDGPNAYAIDNTLIPDFSREHPNSRGTVAFGKAYFKKWMDYDPSGISVIATLAHEFAHIMQFTSGMAAQIRGGLPNDKRNELHADFMAGYYIGRLKKDHPSASFWKAGDKFRQIGNYENKNPRFHGTPEERVNASQQGFRIGFESNTDAWSAFRIGVGYVSNL